LFSLALSTLTFKNIMPDYPYTEIDQGLGEPDIDLEEVIFHQMPMYRRNQRIISRVRYSLVVLLFCPLAFVCGLTVGLSLLLLPFAYIVVDAAASRLQARQASIALRASTRLYNRFMDSDL
jgi:hypothetical protein